MSIRRNTLWNLFGSGGPLLIGLLALPYLLAQIGVERLGVLSLIWALIGYFSVFDLGLGRALTQKVSSLRASGELDLLAGTVHAGLALLAWIGCGGSLLILAVVHLLGANWLNVSPSLEVDVRRCLTLAALSVPVTTLTSGLKGVLEGLERFRSVNLLKALLGFANFAAPVMAVVVYGPSLTAIVAFLIISRLIVFGLHVLSVKKEMSGIVASRLPLGSAQARELLVFGSWMTLSNIVSPLMVVADRFIVSALLGAGVVAYYAVPSDMLLKLLIIPASLSSTLFPVFARHIATSATSAKALYRKAIVAVLLVMCPLMAIVAVGSHAGISVWLGREFADNAYVAVLILSGGIVMNSAAQVPYAMVQAAGRVRQTSLLHVAEFLLYAPLLYFATITYGINGAAAAWTARALVDALTLHQFAKCVIHAEPGRSGLAGT